MLSLQSQAPRYVEGDDPNCQHPRQTREKHGHGRAAVYEWHCPDCGEYELEGYEGDE